MLLLESHDRFDELVELDPSTGRLDRHSRRGNPSMVTRPISGAFSQLDSHLVFLYREADTLHFRVGSQDVELTDDTHIELVQGQTNQLTVMRGSQPVLLLQYKAYVADEVDQWRMYINPFVEDEHLDFGLFVWRVTQDLSQRKALYRTRGHPQSLPSSLQD